MKNYKEDEEIEGLGKKKAFKKRKMKPYIGSNKEEGKYYYNEEEGAKVSSGKRKNLKLEVKNANRSMVKAARQDGKNEIKKALNNNGDKNI
jgi:hypothetical protein